MDKTITGKNEFAINIKENGTYAFYIIANGKVKGYLRFKIKGFEKMLSVAVE